MWVHVSFYGELPTVRYIAYIITCTDEQTCGKKYDDMLLVWVCSNGIVSVPSNTRCVDTFRLDMDMTRCTCNKLSDCPQGLGFPVDLPHNGHMSTQHIHPTPPDW